MGSRKRLPIRCIFDINLNTWLGIWLAVFINLNTRQDYYPGRGKEMQLYAMRKGALFNSSLFPTIYSINFYSHPLSLLWQQEERLISQKN